MTPSASAEKVESVGRERRTRTDATFRICRCGASMEPHIAEARDPVGTIVYVFVWHCRGCRRVTR